MLLYFKDELDHFWPEMMEALKEFLESSTIHGLNYISTAQVLSKDKGRKSKVKEAHRAPS